MTVNPHTTWLYGPNRRMVNITRPAEPWTVHMQLFDPEPGDHWVPALAAELLTPRILVPVGNPDNWRFLSTNFAWRLHWHRRQLDLVIRYRPNGSAAFVFFPQMGVQERVVSVLTDATDNYAFNGSMSFAWGDL